MFVRNFILLLSLGLAFSFYACGGGSDPVPVDNSPTVLNGEFIDSVVQGLQFTTSTQSDSTNSLGIFHYVQGETITFSIGAIVIGQGTAKSRMTPIDLVTGATDETDPTVINICRFLQTLDDDGTPANGIVIPSTIVTQAVSMSLDFDVSTAQFGVSQADSQLIATLTALTSAGQRTLVSADDALLHFRDALGIAPTCTDADGDTYYIEGGECGTTDCNDTDSTINPGATEVCGDLVDNDCDGTADELVECGSTNCTDADGDTFSTEGGECGEVDCDDTDISVNPDATEVCEDGIDNDCSGEDSICQPPTSNFTNNGDGTVTDSDTSLMWQREDDDTKRDFVEAAAYCGASTLAGYSDWYVPSLSELESLVDATFDDPLDDFVPWIDATAFPNTNPSNYWSYTSVEGSDNRAYHVNFAAGVTSSSYKSTNDYVRCVRVVQ